MADKFRVVTFRGGHEEHARFFEIIYKAAAERGGQSADPQRRHQGVPVEKARIERRILRALNAISVPAGETPAFTPGKPVPWDLSLHALRPDGGELRLAQGDFTVLLGYVDDVPLPPQLSEIKVDCYDWLDQAEKVDAEG